MLLFFCILFGGQYVGLSENQSLIVVIVLVVISHVSGVGRKGNRYGLQRGQLHFSGQDIVIDGPLNRPLLKVAKDNVQWVQRFSRNVPKCSFARNTSYRHLKDKGVKMRTKDENEYIIYPSQPEQADMLYQYIVSFGVIEHGS